MVTTGCCRSGTDGNLDCGTGGAAAEAWRETAGAGPENGLVVLFSAGTLYGTGGAAAVVATGFCKSGTDGNMDCGTVGTAAEAWRETAGDGLMVLFSACALYGTGVTAAVVTTGFRRSGTDGNLDCGTWGAAAEAWREAAGNGLMVLFFA